VSCPTNPSSFQRSKKCRQKRNLFPSHALIHARRSRLQRVQIRAHFAHQSRARRKGTIPSRQVLSLTNHGRGAEVETLFDIGRVSGSPSDGDFGALERTFAHKPADILAIAPGFLFSS